MRFTFTVTHTFMTQLPYINEEDIIRVPCNWVKGHVPADEGSLVFDCMAKENLSSIPEPGSTLAYLREYRLSQQADARHKDTSYAFGVYSVESGATARFVGCDIKCLDKDKMTYQVTVNRSNAKPHFCFTIDCRIPENAKSLLRLIELRNRFDCAIEETTKLYLGAKAALREVAHLEVALHSEASAAAALSQHKRHKKNAV